MTFLRATIAGSAILLRWIPLRLPPSTQACMDTAWSSGTLSLNTTVEMVTLASPSGSSCACCALCHRNPACVSLSFSASTRECRLHGVVASYATLEPNDLWQYFVMPGRSQHHQFCRQDSDCQEDGDFCRGRVCTELTTVTCRNIYETFGAGMRYGEWPKMYVCIGNHSILLTCRMVESMSGFTLVLMSVRSFGFTRDNVGFFITQTESGAFSILDLAESLRQLRNTSTYSLIMYGSLHGKGKLTVEFNNVPKWQPVVSSEARTEPVGDITTNTGDKNLKSVAMPYRHAEGDVLIQVKATTKYSKNGVRSLARTDGRMWGDRLDTLRLYMLE